MTTLTAHRSHTHRRYGLTCAEYDGLVALHGGACGICREPGDLVVDHDHDYDERAVRGLVCHHPCNVGLGPVDAGLREPSAEMRAYLDTAWHREHRPGLPLLERRPGVSRPDANPVGAGEIALMLGVSRQRIQQLRLRPGFPEPWVELAQGTLWRDTDIEAWAATRKATRGRPKKATS